MAYDKDYYERNKVTINAKKAALRRHPIEGEAIRTKDRAWRIANPKAIRERWLQYSYCMSPYQWNAMFKKQGGRCAICKTTDPGGPKGWHTDADHTVNPVRVRGLLCRTCNTGLGKFKHSPELMRKAARYLLRG